MSTPSLLNIPYRLKAGTLYSQLPETGAGDFTVTRTTTVANRSTRINSQGFIEIVNDNVPRLDYPLGGAVNGCPALLVEPAATNGIRNNSMVGAVAGSPGTMPTNWAESLNGLVRQSVALGTENGVSYIDIRYSGTATGSSCAVLFENATQIVASTGQTWSNSVYLKIIAQPNPPIAYRLSMWEYNTSGTVFGGSFPTVVVPTTTSLQRFTQTRALTGATTDRIRPLFDVSMTSGQSYDFTIRIGYPQMEQGSVATSVIPTTTAAVTRSADVISRTSASALIGQSEGTIYAEVDVRNFTNSARVIALSDGTGGNAINLQLLAPDKIRVTVNLSSSSQADFHALMPAGVNKLALGYAQNNIALYLNGTSVGTSTSCNIPATNKVDLGSLNGSTILNDRIRAAAIYPNRLPNTAAPGVLSLATLTTP